MWILKQVQDHLDWTISSHSVCDGGRIHRHFRQSERHRRRRERIPTYQRHHPIAVYSTVLESTSLKQEIRQEAALAHAAASPNKRPWKKYRTSAIQVILENTVLIVSKLILWAYVLRLASKTENAGPAVPPGWEWQSTQKGLGKKYSLQWVQGKCWLQRRKCEGFSNQPWSK